ncbi:MAG: hypothetical protein HC849_15095 [Oscillatoriales cyanobacterium RU_3_3]|nr:hypothetical protein [Oscillatoriales cyanobacterium RU_3_3]
MKKEEARRKKEEGRGKRKIFRISPICQSPNLPICQSHNLPIAQSKI